MTTPIKPIGQSARDLIHDERTALVKEMLARESAERDARTIRLRELRLAKEAEEKSEAVAPVAEPRRARKKH